MTRAAVYLRVSSSQQADGDRTSLPEQRRILTELATHRGWDHDVFEEVGSAGDGAAGLPILSQVLGRITQGDYQYLLAIHLDRLNRGGVGEGEKLKRILAAVGCEIVTPGGNFDPRSDSDDLSSDMHWLIAKQENKLRAHRTHRGADAKARAGERIGGKTAGGYRVVYDADGTPRAEIDEPIASAIRRAYELFIRRQGGVVTVARILAEEGYRAKDGGTIHKQSIAHWLKNPRYAGWEFRRASHTTHLERAHQRRYVTAMDTIMAKSVFWPPIIDQATFDQAQAIWRTRAERISRPAKTPLSGLLRCPRCGSRMRSGTVYNNTRHAYRCNMDVNSTRCGQTPLLTERLYPIVLAAVKGILSGAWPEAAAPVSARMDRAALEARLARVERDEATLTQALLDGTLTADQVSPRSQQLAGEKRRLRAELATATRSARAPAKGPRWDPAALDRLTPDPADPAFFAVVQGLVAELHLREVAIDTEDLIGTTTGAYIRPIKRSRVEVARVVTLDGHVFEARR